jgi:probable F420-dependent oxidoreductase
LWTVEHVVVPSGYQSQYPYSPTGRMPGGEDVPIPDPLIWLAYTGAVTKHINLATGILILPQRNPVILAKELATLDRLVGGRVVLGVGVGWLQEEFDALGVPFERRGHRTDEYVDVLRRMWRESETSYDGEFTRFAPLKSFPKPARAGGPPIHIGGHTLPAARRAGRIGDGFFPGRVDEELEILLAEMRRAAADAGRDADEIEITSGGALDLDAVKKAADMGVDRYSVPPLGFDLETLRTNLGKFSENVIAKAPQP